MTLGEQNAPTQQMTRDIKLNQLVGSELDKPVDGEEKKSRNKDLTKTKMCIYFAQGQCSLGADCQFAHSASEMRSAPNLTKTQLCKQFMNGRCRNENCTYAHGEAELVNTPSFKKKMCHWHARGKCRNGASCGFAHSMSELIPGAEQPEKQTKPPGLEVDWDASTVAPSSSRKSGISGMSSVSRGSMPDENLYRMMAGRGSAPLKEQVASMGAAIADLQAKLSEVESKMTADQRSQMQQSLHQLSSQYNMVEAADQKQTAVKTSNMNPAAQPFYPSKTVATDDDSTANRRSNSLVKKPRPKLEKPVKLSRTNRPAAKAMSWKDLGGRAALGALTIGLMVMVELFINQ